MLTNFLATIFVLIGFAHTWVFKGEISYLCMFYLLFFAPFCITIQALFNEELDSLK